MEIVTMASDKYESTEPTKPHKVSSENLPIEVVIERAADVFQRDFINTVLQFDKEQDFTELDTAREHALKALEITADQELEKTLDEHKIHYTQSEEEKLQITAKSLAKEVEKELAHKLQETVTDGTLQFQSNTALTIVATSFSPMEFAKKSLQITADDSLKGLLDENGIKYTKIGKTLHVSSESFSAALSDSNLMMLAQKSQFRHKEIGTGIG